MMKRKKHFIRFSILMGIWLAVMVFTGSKRYPGADADCRWDDSLRIEVLDTEMPILPVRLDSIPPVTISYIDSLCRITENDTALYAFFRQLDELRQRKDTVVNIVHLGDSHVQAGFLTGRVMRRMQAVFGNAGRGWIAPFKLSKQNEPDDYFIKSVVRDWVTGRCIQSTRKTPIGVGGIGIQTVSPSVNFDIVIGPVNGAGYLFNEAILYRCERSMPMLPAGTLKDSVTPSLAASPAVAGILADTFRISCLTDTLQIQSTRRKQGTDTLLPASSFSNTYFGFQLRNGGPGLLYHSIGVNGAMFVHYTDRNYLEKLALLRPSLLIVSMGTNESFGRRFNTPEFEGQVRAFVRLVKEVLPETTLMLTTPAECYKRVVVNKKRTYIRHANIEKAAEAITHVAREEGLLCWDLFALTGGKNSYKNWYEKKLMGRDRIHFNKDGYWEQGELLFRSLMRSYEEGVRS